MALPPSRRVRRSRRFALYGTATDGRLAAAAHRRIGIIGPKRRRRKGDQPTCDNPPGAHPVPSEPFRRNRSRELSAGTETRSGCIGLAHVLGDEAIFAPRRAGTLLRLAL